MAAHNVCTENSTLRYFSHTNYMNKRIVSDEKTFKKYMGDRWNDLPTEHQDALLDLLFVDDNIRGFYADEKRFPRRSTDNIEEIQESFPRLFINSGNKINVDFENDLWTWRDEHSGPFSWMSKSQQDLTLSSLEPDNILKPQPKSLRVDGDEEKSFKVADPQFSYPSSSWCHSVIDDFRKHEHSITLSPSASVELLGVTTESSLDDTDHIEHSGEASPSSDSPHDINLKEVTNNRQSVPVLDRKSSGKDRNRRSPSPKKIHRGGSFRKSPSKASDCGEQKLITGDDSELDDKTHAFSNPVMESEWSTFVGHTNDEDVTSSKTQESPLTYAPKSMTMNRGDYQDSYSPSLYRDDERLIGSTDSPAQASSRSVTMPDSSEDSVQSTPDHTTHLLKGIQSPIYSKTVKSKPVQLSSMDMSDTKNITEELDCEETEEVLIVAKEGDKIVVTTQVENKRDSDIPVTGFDFLDDW